MVLVENTIENRMIGLKSREIYEVPGAKLLIKVHTSIRRISFNTDEIRFAEYMSTLRRPCLQSSFWQEKKEDMDQAIDNMQRRCGKEMDESIQRNTPINKRSDFSFTISDKLHFEDKETDQREVEGMIKYHEC